MFKFLHIYQIGLLNAVQFWWQEIVFWAAAGDHRCIASHKVERYLLDQLANSFSLVRASVPRQCCSETLKLADGQVVYAAKCLEGDGQKDEPLLPAGISGVPHFSVICLVKSPALASSGSSKIGPSEGTGHGNVQGGIFPITPPSDEDVAWPGCRSRQ